MTERSAIENATSYEELLWQKALAHARREAELMYSDPVKRDKEVGRLAMAEYLKLRYP